MAPRYRECPHVGRAMMDAAKRDQPFPARDPRLRRAAERDADRGTVSAGTQGRCTFGRRVPTPSAAPQEEWTASPVRARLLLMRKAPRAHRRARGSWSWRPRRHRRPRGDRLPPWYHWRIVSYLRQSSPRGCVRGAAHHIRPLPALRRRLGPAHRLRSGTLAGSARRPLPKPGSSTDLNRQARPALGAP